MFSNIRKKWRFFLSVVARLNESAASFFLIGYALLVYQCCRLALYFVYQEFFILEPRPLRVFLLGQRIDLFSAFTLAAVPLCVQIILPFKISQRLIVRKILLFYYTSISILLLFVEISTFRYLQEFGHRPHRTYMEYLGRLQEVTLTLLIESKLLLAGTFIGLFLVLFFFIYSYRFLLKKIKPSSRTYRLVTFAVFVIIIALGAQKKNLPNTSLSRQHIVNEIAFNSTYSLAFAAMRLFEEGNPYKIYPQISRQKIFDIVKKSNFKDYSIPPLKRPLPPNIVVIILEGIGALETGFLGGKPLTPNLDRLSQKGIVFTNLYATGTRSARGIEALISGMFPKPGRSIIKLTKSKDRFFTIAELLKKNRYNTFFFYGGDGHFDNMSSFFTSNGFDWIFDQKSWSDKYPKTPWGIHDEHIFKEAHWFFLKQESPHFSVIFTASNHPPFTIPEGKIKLYEQPSNTLCNAVKYTDYALGEFFKMAEKSPYYKNTIFLIVSDHNLKVYGEGPFPLEKFQIPAILLGPLIPKRKYEKITSQADLAPTLLHYAGIKGHNRMMGRNLIALPFSASGRAMMQYGQIFGYLKDQKMIVIRPWERPRTYLYQDKKLVPTDQDHELTEEALAHSLYAWIMYDEQLYYLSDKI